VVRRAAAAAEEGTPGLESTNLKIGVSHGTCIRTTPRLSHLILTPWVMSARNGCHGPEVGGADQHVWSLEAGIEIRTKGRSSGTRW